MTRPVALAVAVALAVGLRAAPALADPKTESLTHVNNSAKLFQGGKYADALAELMTAYSLDPQPGLLYAIAQVHVKLGECADAITWYQKFLDTHPEDRASKAAHEAIDMCATALPKTPEPAPTPTPAPALAPTPPPQPVQPTQTTEQRSTPVWYGSVVADALVLGGAVAGATGIELYHRALGDFDKANTATDYAAHHELVEDGRSARTWAIVASAGGVALVGGGIAYYMLSVRGNESTFTVTPTATGTAVMWSGRF